MAEDHDFWEPKLRVAASGLGGSGYRIPTRQGADGKPLLVPGVTTVLNALDKGGVTQWAVNNTAAWAIANKERLADMQDESAYGFLRWYWNRMKSSDFDDPAKDLRDASNGVLNDLAELGTKTHDYIADFITGRFPAPPDRDETVDMAEAFHEWYDQHDVEPVVTEVTVVGDGYAGTLDHIWIVDGVALLIDAKTSRAIRSSHIAQLGALGAAESMMRQVTADTPGAAKYTTKKWGDTYWVEEPVPPFSKYAVLHLRPGDFDSRGTYIEPFCRLEFVSQERVNAGYRMFRGALEACLAEREMKQLTKKESAK